MEELNLVFKRLSIDEPRLNFDCGDKDLNEYFSDDSKDGTKELVSVTYAIIEEKLDLVGYFCVSNDAIRKEDTGSNNQFKKLRSQIKPSKRYSSMPAVKIGRLATAQKYQSMGIGRKALDLIKMWFTQGNKTGCRFILVDAMNNARTIKFYEKNGFKTLKPMKDKNETTVLMFFDLITFKP